MNNANLCESALGVNASAHYYIKCDPLSVDKEEKSLHRVFVERVKAEMGRLKWSQNDLAEACKAKNQGNISRMLRNEAPTLTTVDRIAKALDVPAQSLFDENYQAAEIKVAAPQLGRRVQGKYAGLQGGKSQKTQNTVRLRTKQSAKRTT